MRVCPAVVVIVVAAVVVIVVVRCTNIGEPQTKLERNLAVTCQ